MQPKTTIEEEVADLLSIAAKAAHKLALNRSLYRYAWMDEISAEVRDLEAVADRLRACSK